MVETVVRRRIELLVDTPLAPRITRIAAEVGISGWTLIDVRSGYGRGGTWTSDALTGAEDKVIILMIAGDERTDAFVTAVAPLLESHGLLLTIGDVRVIRGERF